ncbi:G-protein coupled receptor 6-like [Branchiostoma floridae x Branchiostoma japonicum]
MNRKSSCIGATLVILLVTARYTGIHLASGASLNVTEQAEETTVRNILHNSTCRNGSSENYDNLSITNNSKDDLKSPTVYIEDKSTVGAYITLCVGVWSVAANSLPLAAIVKYEQLHTPVYILMANLAVSDVLVSTQFVIRSIFVLAHKSTQSLLSNTAVRLSFTPTLVFGMSSAYGLLALTAERYWFIVHGMTYVNNVDNGKCKVMVLIIWVWSVVLGMLPNFGWHCASPTEEGCSPMGGGLPHGYIVLIQASIVIAMAGIILLNTGVFWCLWKHMNAIADQQAAVGAESSTSSRSAITIVIITVMFLVGWLPFLVKLAFATGVNNVQIFIILNSAINPVIYGLRLSEVRRSVVRLFANCSGNGN